MHALNKPHTSASKGCKQGMTAPETFIREAVTHAGHLAELETAAWKDDRRFRVISADQGVLSFVDLFMHTPNKPHTSAWRGCEQGMTTT